MGVVVKFEHWHGRSPEVMLGPFRALVIQYTTLFSDDQGAIASLTPSGTWQIGLTDQVLKRYGTQFDGNEYTDVTLETVSEDEFRA